MKKILATIIGIVLLGQVAYAGNINTDNSENILAEANLILTMQKPSGAFGLTPDSPHIVPYYANLALQGLPELGSKYARAVKRYINWYFSKMNKTPDEIGVKGTIYDYIVVTDENGNSVELPEYIVDPTKKIYDSSDSYAATFLSLVNAYHEATGDDKYVKKHLSGLFKVARAIDATMQPNGLTWAKADYHAAYMMDNTEVWRGYKDFAELLSRIGDDRRAALYEKKANKVARAIEKVLWDEENQGYRPYEGHDVSWDVYYPDGRANMRAIMFELPGAVKREKTLFKNFIDNNPEWITNEAGDSPNVATSVAGVRAGYTNIVTKFLDITNENFADRSWPWKISESGYYIQTLSLLQNTK